MTRSCFHCGAEIEMTDAHCPFCSAMQSKPGDPFIGFLIHHAGDIAAIVASLILIITMAIFLINVLS